MKEFFSLLFSLIIVCGSFTLNTYASESDVDCSPRTEIISYDNEFANISENEAIDNLTDRIWGVRKPSTSATWDIYLQNYVFNLDFDTALYTNYNFTNHGGEIKVTVTCNSANPNKIKMELYKAGETECLTTMELEPNGTTTGRFYDLDLKTNYYFKFVTPNGYSVTGEGRLYKE